MRDGLDFAETWPVEARLLALDAQLSGRPGEWTGRACLAGGEVEPDDLAAAVSRFGAMDVIVAGTLADGERYDDADAATREQMLDDLMTDSLGVITGMQERSYMFKVHGRDLGDRWTVARFVHTLDCHTRQRRLHTHNVVVFAGAMAEAVTV